MVLEDIARDLTAYWRMSETSGTRFDLIGGVHLADVNTVGSAAGKIGTAADFVRVNSEELTAGTDDFSFDGSADFAIAFWASIDDNTDIGSNTQGPAVGKFINSNRGWLINFDQASDSWEFAVSTDGTDIVIAVSGTNFVSTAFGLVYADYDSSTGVTRCSTNDGTKGTASPGTTINQNSEPFRVGATRYEGLGGFSDYFEGQIDELAIWRRKLTDTEVTQMHNSGNGVNLQEFLPTGAMITII